MDEIKELICGVGFLCNGLEPNFFGWILISVVSSFVIYGLIVAAMLLFK